MPLARGQNLPLPVRRVRFVASSPTPLDVSALVANADLQALTETAFVFYNNPATPGVTLEQTGLLIDLDRVRRDADAVLCLVSVDPATAAGKTFREVRGTLVDDSGAEVAVFDVPLLGGETAVICFELYRRRGDWKVRAVGQGYAGGLAQLIPAHGIEVAAPAPKPSNPTLCLPNPAPAAVPLDRARAYDRMWMIFEDAARSASAFISASSYATDRLDDELSAAVADPAMRNSGAADAARGAAQRRHDDLVATARRNYDADSAQLAQEIRTIDPDLPRSLASWDSPVWQSASAAPDPTDGIRIGEVSAPERGPLRVPFCVRLPLLRPIWVVSETSSAATPVVASLVARMLSATVPTPQLDIIDLTSSLDLLTVSLSRLLGGPVVRSHTDVTARIESIANALELADMARRSGMADLHPPGRVVVLSDFPHGYSEVDVSRVLDLAAAGPDVGLSLIIVGASEVHSAEPQLNALARHCQNLPVAGELRMLDPWTHSGWEFAPDVIPVDAHRRAQVMGLLDKL